MASGLRIFDPSSENTVFSSLASFREMDRDLRYSVVNRAIADMGKIRER
jgi:hypothetical protein